MRYIHDISQPVGTATAVWPGDQPFTVRWTMRRADGHSVNVAALTMSAHTGTHADGPYHVDDEGARPGELGLEAYIGPAVVVDAVGCELLDEDVVAGLDLNTDVRVLFHTRERVEPGVFPDRFAALSPALANRLGRHGVRLVGTDAPSVDPVDSTSLPAHRALGDAGVAILENLVLAGVRPGRYTLVALPLKLAEADSSPVRAVLLEDRADGTST